MKGGDNLSEMDDRLKEIEKKQRMIMKYAKSMMNAPLDNIVSKGQRDKFIKKYSKEDIEMYLASPKKYESKLREVVDYLCSISPQFQRLIEYIPNMAYIAPFVKQNIKSYKDGKKSTKIDKKNPAYLYLKELQRSQEYMKKRNQTARLYKSKMNFHFDKTSDSSTGLGHFSKTNTQFASKGYKKKDNILEKKHNQMLNQMNDPKNPYSTYWSSKILDKRYNMKFEVTGFLNGVPVINVQKKKNDVNE